ncbi:hypothetical protein [Peribacillus deserti]|uniref:hypothetical protein n=1 Tax=Peribacillus deserti TaxID=673318 RepID=UPI0021536D26|nr:hypothetical protein [Peribacillus deserti]
MMTGINKNDASSITPVTMLVNPVRPPAVMPASIGIPAMVRIVAFTLHRQSTEELLRDW